MVKILAGQVNGLCIKNMQDRLLSHSPSIMTDILTVSSPLPPFANPNGVVPAVDTAALLSILTAALASPSADAAAALNALAAALAAPATQPAPVAPSVDAVAPATQPAPVAPSVDAVAAPNVVAAVEAAAPATQPAPVAPSVDAVAASNVVAAVEAAAPATQPAPITTNALAVSAGSETPQADESSSNSAPPAPAPANVKPPTAPDGTLKNTIYVKELMMLCQRMTGHYGSGFAFHPLIGEMLQDNNAALVLFKLLNWVDYLSTKTQKWSGWLYHTHNQWGDELNLSKYQVMTILSGTDVNGEDELPPAEPIKETKPGKRRKLTLAQMGVRREKRNLIDTPHNGYRIKTIYKMSFYYVDFEVMVNAVKAYIEEYQIKPIRQIAVNDSLHYDPVMFNEGADVHAANQNADGVMEPLALDEDKPKSKAAAKDSMENAKDSTEHAKDSKAAAKDSGGASEKLDEVGTVFSSHQVNVLTNIIKETVLAAVKELHPSESNDSTDAGAKTAPIIYESKGSKKASKRIIQSEVRKSQAIHGSSAPTIAKPNDSDLKSPYEREMEAMLASRIADGGAEFKALLKDLRGYGAADEYQMLYGDYAPYVTQSLIREREELIGILMQKNSRFMNRSRFYKLVRLLVRASPAFAVYSMNTDSVIEQTSYMLGYIDDHHYDWAINKVIYYRPRTLQYAQNVIRSAMTNYERQDPRGYQERQKALHLDDPAMTRDEMNTLLSHHVWNYRNAGAQEPTLMTPGTNYLREALTKLLYEREEK
jgi:hypothetical protein